MHLTGANAHTPGVWALQTLKDFLIAKLAESPYAAQFESVGGVMVTTNHVEALAWIRSKRSFIVLSLDEGDHQRDLWRDIIDNVFVRGTEHSLGILAELTVPAAGAPGVQALRDALGDIIDRNYQALHALGLEGCTFAPDPAREATGNFVNPHIVGCRVYSL